MVRSKYLLLVMASLVSIFLVTTMLIRWELRSCKAPWDTPIRQVHAISVPKYTPQKFTKFTQKMKEITLQCKHICSQRAGRICVPMDLAIFIYRRDVPTEQHAYDRNKPIIHLPLTEATNRLPKSMAVNECLIEEHFPDMELIPQQRSCAIIGNGGILLGSGCGQAIDAHDFVIRANFAPIQGFEKDVGHKANLSAFNTETLFWFSGSILENPRPDYVQYRDRYLARVHHLNESIIWYLKHLRPPHDEMYQNITKEIRNYKHSKARIAFSWKPISIEKGWNLDMRGTLGFDVFVVARTFCSSISLYGFFPFHKDLAGNNIPHHYYEEIPEFSYKNDVHNFKVEYQQLKELDANGDLKLVVGACKPSQQNQLKIS